MTDGSINTKPGSRANNTDESAFTIIHWRPHELRVACCVILGCTALIFFTLGAFAGASFLQHH